MDLLQPAQEALPVALERLACRGPIDQCVQVVVVADRRLVEHVDEGAPVQFDGHPALLLESDECLANGNAADAEHAGHIVLGNAVTRAELPVEDQAAQEERGVLSAAAPGLNSTVRRVQARHYIYDTRTRRRGFTSSPRTAGKPWVMAEVRSRLQGTVARIERAPGQDVEATTTLVIIESMKMEYPVEAGVTGAVQQMLVAVGDAVQPGDLLAVVAPSQAPSHAQEPEPGVTGDVAAGALSATVASPGTRADLAEVLQRHAIGQDHARPDAVERRRRSGQRTARENVDDLCDPGSFVEYGPLVIAAQRRRRPVEELIERTPADGLVAGVGTVDGRPTAVLSYDYTVLAGTQGLQNHRKKDRLFEIIERQHLPVVFFAEGGGGRPGDTDGTGVSGLDCLAFNLWAGLSGLVPLVGVASGRCFAGNAAILGCCDVIIATDGTNIGMGGPAMIEGGGLGRFAPEEIGPLGVQTANGVVDIAVPDEAEAVRVARQYLGYFGQPRPNGDNSDSAEGSTRTWSCADQAHLRDIIPENRRQVYDIRAVIDTLADEHSVLELRPQFGRAMITALARVEGRPVGIVANDPGHLAGAIDADAADKAARFMQICDAFDVPLLFLCDTPGIMVGPDAETAALVRHANRLFVTGANLTVPFGTIVLRRGYGLGAQAMAGGSFKAPLFCVAWPTGEFGGMGLEGAVRLGYRRELDAIADPAERESAFQEMVARAYEHGKALNAASHFEIDDVIDPADSRRWIRTAFAAASPPPPRSGKKRPYIDTW
jgi:acetyl-CoA carboxylase carboxyltransferase component/biotin carboxyl carrier protein